MIRNIRRNVTNTLNASSCDNFSSSILLFLWVATLVITMMWVYEMNEVNFVNMMPLSFASSCAASYATGSAVASFTGRRERAVRPAEVV